MPPIPPFDSIQSQPPPPTSVMVPIAATTHVQQMQAPLMSQSQKQSPIHSFSDSQNVQV